MFGLKKKGIELLLRGELIEFIEDDYGEAEGHIPVEDSKMIIHFIPNEEAPVLFTTGLSFFEQSSEEDSDEIPPRIELIAFLPPGTTFEEVCEDEAYERLTDFMTYVYVDLEEGGRVTEGTVIWADDEKEDDEDYFGSWALPRADMDPSVCKSDFVGRVQFLQVIQVTTEEREFYEQDKMSIEDLAIGLPNAHRLSIVDLLESEFGESTDYFQEEDSELIIHYIPGDLCTILFTTGLSFVGQREGELVHRLELMAYLPQGISFEAAMTGEEYRIFSDLMMSSYENLNNDEPVYPGGIYWSDKEYPHGFDSAIIFLSLMDPSSCKATLGKVDMFSIVPLYKSEKEFFREHGSADPWQALIDNEVSPVYDPHRKQMNLFDF